jgi:hypothetical protein
MAKMRRQPSFIAIALMPTIDRSYALRKSLIFVPTQSAGTMVLTK